MSVRSRALLVALLAILPAPAARAQSGAPARSPTADEVLDRYVKVIGGRDAIAKHTSSVMKGTLEVANLGLKGTIEITTQDPGKVAITTVIEGIGSSRQGFDGKDGWSEDPISGLRDMDSRERALVERSTLSSDVRWRDVFERVEFVGTQSVSGRPAHVVKLVARPGMGPDATNAYDAESGLLVRSEMILDTAAATMPVTTTFSDYRQIGDVLVATRMAQILPTATLVTVFTDIRFDVKIDPAVFARPKP